MGKSDYSNIPNFSGDTNPYMPCLDSKGNYKPETPDQTKLFNALYPSSKANYMHVVPNSHFWTDLNQIIASINYQLERTAREVENTNTIYVGEPLTKEYIIIGLNNSIKNGYKIKQVGNMDLGRMVYPVFSSIDEMIEYAKKDYFNLQEFHSMIKSTIEIGLNLTNGLKMERQEIYKRLDGERDYQDKEWGTRKTLEGTPDEEKPVAEWINYIEYHLSKAKERVYYLDTLGALAELRKVTALGVRAMEIHGCPERKAIVDPPTDKDDCEGNGRCDC
jgi:hypothetical protein